MTTLFSKMLNIVGDLAGSQVNERSSLSPAFLEKNQDDFFERDREVIQQETVAGDKYIWIIKGNGSGTSLEHSAELCAETRICSANEKSKFYLISCSDRDAGEIEEITQEKALSIASKNRGFFEHRPVRQDIIEAISEHTGIDKLSLQEMQVFNDLLKPTPDEDIFLKFEFDEKMNKVVIDMAKPCMKDNDPNKRKHAVFLFSAQNREITERVKEENLFLKIKPCNNASRGKVKEISQSDFEAADRTAKKRGREHITELTF